MEKKSTILNDEILSKCSENSITSSSSSKMECVSASGIDDNNDKKKLINVNLTNLSSDKNRVIRKIKLINPEKIQKIDVKQKIAEALKKFHESNNTSNNSETNVNKLSDNINSPEKSSSISSSLHKNESELLSKLDKDEKSLRTQSVKSILNKKLKEKAKNESKIQAECSNSIKNAENLELKIDKEIKISDNNTSILNITNTESSVTSTKPGRKIKPKPNLKISKTVKTSKDKISINVQDNDDYSSNIQRNNTDLFESPSYSPIGHSPVSPLIIKEEEIEENGSEKLKLNEEQQQIKVEKEEENNFYGFSDDMVKQDEIIIKKLTDFLEKQKIHNEKYDFNHSPHTNINENHRTNVIPSFSNLKSYLFEKWQNNEGKQQKNTQNDQNIPKSKDKNNVTVVIEVNKPKNNEPALTEEVVVVEQQKQEIIVPNEMVDVKTEKINISEKRSYRRKVTPISVKKHIDENKSKKLIESVEKLPENISISSNAQIINSENSIEINKSETNNSSNLTINQGNSVKREVTLKILNYDPISGDVQMKLIDPILSADKIQHVVENITSQSSCNTKKSNEISSFSSTSISSLPSSSSTAPVAILIPKIIKTSQNITTSTNSKLNKSENKNSIEKYENSVVQRKLKVQQCQPKQQKSLLKKSIKPVNRFKTNLQTVPQMKRKLKSSKKFDKQSGDFTTSSEAKSKRILLLRVKDILKAKEISIEKVQEVINQQVSEFVGTKIDLGKNYAIKVLEKLEAKLEAKSKLELTLNIEDIMNKLQKYSTLDILCKNENDLQLNKEKIKLYNILNVPVKDELDEKCLVIENNPKEMNEIKASNAVDFLLNYSDNMKFDNNDNDDLIINISDDDNDYDDDDNNCNNDYNVIEIEYDNDEIITMKKEESNDYNEQNNKNVAEIINVNDQNYVYMMNSTPIVLEDKLLTEQEKIKIFSLDDCEQISLQDEIVPSGGIMKIKNEDKALEIALQNQFIFSPNTMNDTSNIFESRDCSNSLQIDDLIGDFKIEENQFDTKILNTEQIEDSKLNQEDKSKIQLPDDDELLNAVMNELSKIIPDSNESNCKTEKENLLYKIEDIKIENIQNTENAYPSNIKPIDPKYDTAAASKTKKKRKSRKFLPAIIKTKSNLIQSNINNKNIKKFVKLSETNIKENSIGELEKCIKIENETLTHQQIDDIKKEEAEDNSLKLRILSEVDDGGDDDDDDDEKLIRSLNKKPKISDIELKRKLLRVFSQNFKKKAEKMNTLKKESPLNTVQSFEQFSQKCQNISDNVNADDIDEISKQYNSLIADNEIQSETTNCDDDDKSRDVQNTTTYDEQLISEKCSSISEEKSKKLNEENVEIKNISVEKEKEGKDKTILNTVSSPLSTTRSGRKIKLTEKIASFNLVKMKKATTSISSVTKMMTTRENEQNEMDVIDPKCVSNEKNLENILQNEQIEQQLKEKESEKMHEIEEKSTEVIDDHHQFSDNDNFESIEENLKCLGEGNCDESDEENDHCTNVLTATELNVNVSDPANNENENDNLLPDKSLNEIDNVKSFQLELLQSLESPKRRNTFKDTTTTAAAAAVADTNFNANVMKKSRTISLSSPSKGNREKIGIKFSVKYGDNSDNKIKSDNEELINLLKKKTMAKNLEEKPIKRKYKNKKNEIIKHESMKRKRENESDQNKSINKVEKNPKNSKMVVDKISSESSKKSKSNNEDDDNDLEPDTKEMYDIFIKTIKFDNFEPESETSIKRSKKPKSDVKRKRDSVNTKKINTAKDSNGLKENKINKTNENSIEVLIDNNEDNVEIIESNEQNNTIKIELNDSDNNSVSPIKDNDNEKQYQEEKLDDDRKLHPKLLLITNRSDLDNDNPTSLEIQNENKIPGKKELKCGLCKEIVGIESWVTHLSDHYGVGWREGIDPPINVESYRSVLLACQRYFKDNKVKSLKCRLCGILRKSALGLLGHLELCNLTKEEKLKQFVKCEYCDKSYPPWTIMQHQRFSCSNRFKNNRLQKEQEQQQEQNDSSNLDISFSNSGRHKRQSVIKAEKKFAEDNIDEKLTSDDDKFAKSYNAPCRSILLWRYRGQIKNNGFAKCIGVNCDYMSSNENELMEHNEDCTKIIRKGYACIECNYLDIEMDNVVQHYKNTHKKGKNSKKKIHVHASESEAEFDSESSEDEVIYDDDDDDDDDDDNVSGDDVDGYMKGEYDLDSTYNNRRKKKRNRRKNKYKIFNLNETNSENQNWKKLIEYEGHQDQTKLSLEKTLEFNKYNYSDTPLYEFAIPILTKINNPLETYFPNNLHSIKFAYNTKNTFNDNFGSSKLPNNNNNNNTDTTDNNEWQQMNRFTIKSISYNEKLLFIGGPVIIMKWLPLPKSIEIDINKQYLLVTCKRDLYEFTKCINQELIKTIILIYEFDMKLMKLNKNYIPKLLYGIIYDYGPIHNIELIESGGYSIELNRLGLMAIGCIKSNIEIYSLPIKASKNCDDNNYCYYYDNDNNSSSSSSSNCNNINNSNNIKIDDNDNKLLFINLKPSIILKLDMKELNIDNDISKFYKEAQCLKICWSKAKNHNIIGGAYSNGFISLWNIDDDDENLSKFMINDVRNFVTISYFQATTSLITGFEFHYDMNGLRWLFITVKWKEALLFDVQDLTVPKLIMTDSLELCKGPINGTIWPVIWESPLYFGTHRLYHDYGYVNSLSPLNIHYSTRRVLRTASEVLTIDYNSLRHILLAGTVNGDFYLFNPTTLNLNLNTKSKIYDRLYLSYTDLIKLDGNEYDDNYEYIQNERNLYDSDYINKYGLIMGSFKPNNENAIKKIHDNKRIPPPCMSTFVKINQVSSNHNEIGNKLIAFGYENGLIRIRKIS